MRPLNLDNHMASEKVSCNLDNNYLGVWVLLRATRCEEQCSVKLHGIRLPAFFLNKTLMYHTSRNAKGWMGLHARGSD